MVATRYVPLAICALRRSFFLVFFNPQMLLATCVARRPGSRSSRSPRLELAASARSTPSPLPRPGCSSLRGRSSRSTWTSGLSTFLHTPHVVARPKTGGRVSREAASGPQSDRGRDLRH